ncbi:hypothetical protein THOM_0931 [Trachipleistophora hominis]|uniref:Uncharacterized protein n=1 Tax=Trachipleistophora hominis TaxID=72359 RepID=L7JYH0_TRAHO|nr:hypothetical protein THOM_0931 [Trachipleistophora hominis]
MKKIEVNDEQGEFYPNAKDESETASVVRQGNMLDWRLL